MPESRESLPLIVKRFADAAEGVFTGLASVPVPDRPGRRAALDCVQRSVAEFKAGRLVLADPASHDPATDWLRPRARTDRRGTRSDGATRARHDDGRTRSNA